MTDVERERQRTDALLHPAPDLPGLQLRPFNDTVLALCSEAGCPLFTLEVLGDQPAGMAARAEALGFRELNRQCLILLFILGFPDKKAMLSALRQPDLYETHVQPWSLDLPPDPARMAKILSEWKRYMLHTHASMVKLLAKPNEDDPDAPPNS